MNRTPTMATRKRRLATPEQTTRTSSAGDAQETSSVASLQTLMHEVQILREEQRRTQLEFAETLRQRDAEIQRLQQASQSEQISPSDNFDSRGGMCDRVAHVSAEGADAHARDCLVKRISYTISIDCSSEPLDGRSENRDSNIMFKRESAGSFGKCIGSRKFKFWRIKI